MCCFRGGALKIEGGPKKRGGLRRLPHSPHPISTTGCNYKQTQAGTAVTFAIFTIIQSMESDHDDRRNKSVPSDPTMTRR